MPSETALFQEKIRINISEFIRTCSFNYEARVEKEWKALREMTDVDVPYSPRTDIAVGPFAIGVLRLERTYDDMMNHFSEKIDLMLSAYRENVTGTNISVPENHDAINRYNQNSRCFIAMEIEKSGTMKHRLGDVVNACSLGRIGIVVAINDSILKSFLRIGTYFGFLRSKGKPTFRTDNLLVLTKEQFIRAFPTVRART